MKSEGKVINGVEKGSPVSPLPSIAAISEPGYNEQKSSELIAKEIHMGIEVL